jgi:hypothetical protein
MIRRNESMMKYFSAAFSAAFLLISIFANCFHTHHPVECASGKSSCHMEKPGSGIIIASGKEHKDCSGDCAACSYLISAQGVYSESIRILATQDSVRYSTAEPDFFHSNNCIEYLPRAPPYFIA